MQAIQCMEQSCELRKKFHGSDGKEYEQATRTLGEFYNYASILYMKQNNYPFAFELLKKAEQCNSKFPINLLATLNHFACYYREKHQLPNALSILKKLIKMERYYQKPSITTYLNLCAVFSELSQHNMALRYVNQAIDMLQTTSEETMTKEEIVYLCVAYYNQGTEYEFLHHLEQAITSYEQGIVIVSKYLDPSIEIASKLQHAIVLARRKLNHHKFNKSKG